jgi:hypothetical protein
MIGWGGRIRTSECRFQRPVSYRLTTPQPIRNSFSRSALGGPSCLRSRFSNSDFFRIRGPLALGDAMGLENGPSFHLTWDSQFPISSHGSSFVFEHPKDRRTAAAH